jgi:histidinol phosphatase-like PHP family hydrolase
MAEIPRYDFHIHTKYLGCADKTMGIFEIIDKCKSLGVKALACTDHINSFDQLELHNLIREDIEQINTDIEVFFGAELNFLGYQQGFAFNEDIKEKYGFEFALGGIHETYVREYDLKKIINIQHEHFLRVCEDPLVQVLVHPYWFSPGEFRDNKWPWPNFMEAVPESYMHELGQASRESNTAIEICGHSILKNSSFNEDYTKIYFDFLAVLAEEGALFSFGSDAHSIDMLETIQPVWEMAKRFNLSENQIWHPRKS